MSKKSREKPPDGSIKISLLLVPGSPEYKAYKRVIAKYTKEIASRHDTASDDEPCTEPYGKSDVARGSILAFADVPQEKVPYYIEAAWKHKGRKSLNGTDDADRETDSSASVDDRPTLLH